MVAASAAVVAAPEEAVSEAVINHRFGPPGCACLCCMSSRSPDSVECRLSCAGLFIYFAPLALFSGGRRSVRAPVSLRGRFVLSCGVLG